MDPLQGIQTVANELMRHGQAAHDTLVDHLAKYPNLPFGIDDMMQGKLPTVAEFSAAAAVATRDAYSSIRMLVKSVPEDLQRDFKAVVALFSELVQDLHPINDQQVFRVTAGNVSRPFLEGMMAAERVKRFADENDLHTRLGTVTPNRAIYALRDPHMDGALISIQTAFTSGLPNNIGAIIAAKDKVTATPDTAAFYSVSNWERVGGMPIGKPFILEVAEKISRERPEINNFVTLSPMPGFRQWLGKADEATLVESGATRGMQHSLSEVRAAAFAAQSLDVLKQSPTYIDLQKLAAHYVTSGRMVNGSFEAADSVANFHPRNGARFERLLPGADDSAQGFQASFGFMANYQYRLADLETNAKAFRQGNMARSEAVQHILNDKAPTSPRSRGTGLAPA